MIRLPGLGHSQSESAISTLNYGALMGLAGIGLFALQTQSAGQFLSVLGVGFVIAGACLLSGGLLGFLFAIPRTLQHDRSEETAARPLGQEQPAASQASYQANTNLEQISDWLTKILVGVGLTQLTAVPGALQAYATFAGAGLGGGRVSETVAVGILVFYLVCGFLISYLWTRLYFAGALRQADLATVGEKLAQVESKLSEVERQAALDAKALSVVQAQLNPGAGTPPTPQGEINAAIIPASNGAKAQIYYLANDTRSKNWRKRETKPLMERTIPIFRALVVSDTDDVYHLNHGQLGFALKDQRTPDWAEAERELSKAIELRGRWQENGWLLYEFNRALCKINLDQAFAESRPTDGLIADQILADLKAATNAPGVPELISTEPTIASWFTVNKVKWPPG